MLSLGVLPPQSALFFATFFLSSGSVLLVHRNTVQGSVKTLGLEMSSSSNKYINGRTSCLFLRHGEEEGGTFLPQPTWAPWIGRAQGEKSQEGQAD